MRPASLCSSAVPGCWRSRPETAEQHCWDRTAFGLRDKYVASEVAEFCDDPADNEANILVQVALSNRSEFAKDWADTTAGVYSAETLATTCLKRKLMRRCELGSKQTK